MQYPRGKGKRIGQVVPDNMVVVHPEPLRAVGSFAVELQPARPFLVVEYVSKASVRKDYDANLRKYERELRVPYYLLFYPDNDELTLFRLVADRYESVGPIATGRRPIPELELEVELKDGWVRYWFRDDLLRLPAELADGRDAQADRADAEAKRADAEAKRADAEAKRADAEHAARLASDTEIARLRAELERLRGG